MAIPESQLGTWIHQGAVVTAKSTHESVRNALNEYEFPEGVSYTPYLQGSYRNSTNIRGDSDVDLVVELTSTFRRDISGLTLSERDRYKEAHYKATYSWSDFREDVLLALREYYRTGKVSKGDKCLKVSGNSNRLDADVVVCMAYRKYNSYPGNSDFTADYVEGMTFWTQRDGRQIINFPKLHYENGVSKNSETDGRFRPAVRMFKNARSYMIDHNQIDKDLAPSYFVECLLYNMPSYMFDSSLSVTYENLLIWLYGLANDGKLDSLQCQNGQLALFGSRSDQWRSSSGKDFLIALHNLWENW